MRGTLVTNATPKIAVFDFDGTLVAKDTFLALLKIGFKSQPWRGVFLLLLCPIFVLNFLLRLDRSLPKSVMLWSITAFRGKRNIIRFLNTTLKNSSQIRWFAEGIDTLERLHNENIEIVIATASGQIWVRSLLRNKFKNSKLIIGTKLKFFAGGVILAGKNCRDHEKLRRIQEQLITKQQFVWHSSWSDHIADIPILKAAQMPYIICPKKKHVPIFKKEFGENVTILYWNQI